MDWNVELIDQWDSLKRVKILLPPALMRRAGQGGRVAWPVEPCLEHQGTGLHLNSLHGLPSAHLASAQEGALSHFLFLHCAVRPQIISTLKRIDWKGGKKKQVN